MLMNLERQKQDREEEREAAERLRRRAEPIRAEIGGDYVEIDPTTGTARTLYKGQPKPASPYRWEANDGSLMEVGVDGTARVVYKDPTPKLMTVFNPATQQYEAVPVTGHSPSSLPTRPVGRLTRIPEGGPTLPASGTFP
jgi:hypothetical protein